MMRRTTGARSGAPRNTRTPTPTAPKNHPLPAPTRLPVLAPTLASLRAGTLSLALGLAALSAQADHQDGETIEADRHAPMGVMGDHLHEKGEWMVSYRFMSMGMEGNLLGSAAIDPDTIVFRVVDADPVVPNHPVCHVTDCVTFGAGSHRNLAGVEAHMSSLNTLGRQGPDRC